MEDWRFQFPSTVITRTVKGDKVLASRYDGEARILLYQLKNLMKFQQLGQLKMVRWFTDGTVITAMSVFGHDRVHIDVSQSIFYAEGATLQEQMCTIILIDMPEIVPPMRYPNEITEGEVKGIDYFKTYYQLDVSKCPSCMAQDIGFGFNFNFDLPTEPLHYDDEPENHCVYTLSPSCWGRILSTGTDENGTYFIWKAFTEQNEYSRTGLGVALFNAEVLDETLKVICNVSQKIKVDCCEKDISLRKPYIYWDYCPYQLGGDCRVPEEPVPFNIVYNFQYFIIPLRVHPERDGGCLPFTWSLKGPGALLDNESDDPSDQFNENVRYTPIDYSNIGCMDRVDVTAKNRCGDEEHFRLAPCCDTADPFELVYTTLLMSCGQSQILSVRGGCPPYSWSLSSGCGSLEPIGQGGEQAVYTAPATNPNCTCNPTITVSECCGSNQSITIAVNCYTGDDVAFRYCEQKKCSSCGGVGKCEMKGVMGRWDYRCDNVLLYDRFLKYPGTEIAAYDCSLTDTPPTGWGCAWNGSHPTCASALDPGWYCAEDYCWNLFNCKGDLSQCPEGCGMHDKRTTAMKNAGCCPLNPMTGLPF